MNELTIFQNAQFGEVRTSIRDGEPWFAAADVCAALEIGNPSQALTRLDDDERFTTLISNDTAASGFSNLAFVSEAGLYSLVLGSRKPEARAFKRWITHEVIPAISKTGGYIAGEETMTDDELLSRALLMASEKIRLRDELITPKGRETFRLLTQGMK